MTPTQAKRAMLRPRKTRCVIGGTPGWYYVEDEGISVFNENCKTAFSVLTWKQIEQAVALKSTSDRGAKP
jgi:hypothetical protein